MQRTCVFLIIMHNKSIGITSNNTGIHHFTALILRLYDVLIYTLPQCRIIFPRLIIWNAASRRRVVLVSFSIMLKRVCLHFSSCITLPYQVPWPICFLWRYIKGLDAISYLSKMTISMTSRYSEWLHMQESEAILHRTIVQPTNIPEQNDTGQRAQKNIPLTVVAPIAQTTHNK